MKRIICCCLTLIVTSMATTEKLFPHDVLSNYEEQGIDGEVLRFDGKTQLFVPPKLEDLPEDKKDEIVRELTISSKWKDKYCKVNFFKSSTQFLTSHFYKPNWCRFLREDNRWQDLCCGNNYCSCDNLTGFDCWCYPKRMEHGQHHGPLLEAGKIMRKERDGVENTSFE